MADIWNDRYAHPEYAYGVTPNNFFAERLLRYRPMGKALLPADGEGRNGVFAAKHGLEVTSFDLSEAGSKKALQLASDQKVAIDYRLGDFREMGFEEGSFDLLALIYAHFSGDVKQEYNRALASYLRTGALLIFEAFGSQHLGYRNRNPSVGGPDDAEMLFSTGQILTTFPHFETLYLAEEVIELNEGKFHRGTGSVVRFVGRKL